MKKLQITALIMCVGLTACGSDSPTSPSRVPSQEAPPPTPSPPPPDPPAPTIPVPGSWSDDFSGGVLSPKWIAIQGAGGRQYASNHVDLSQGMLGLRLTQVRNADGSFTSLGGEVQSRQTYGFGTYTWVMRSSSTALTPMAEGRAISGSSSGVFNFFNNSETEIDFEVEGNRPNTIHLVIWHIQLAPKVIDASVASDTGFHEYRFKWYPDRIESYIDGVYSATEKTVVPQSPAYVMMNHWGTTTIHWGGEPTEGTRYMWIRSFSFSPHP